MRFDARRERSAARVEGEGENWRIDRIKDKRKMAITPFEPCPNVEAICPLASCPCTGPSLPRRVRVGEGGGRSSLVHGWAGFGMWGA
jgi:hypothetical protein